MIPKFSLSASLLAAAMMFVSGVVSATHVNGVFSVDGHPATKPGRQAQAPASFPVTTQLHGVYPENDSPFEKSATSASDWNNGDTSASKAAQSGYNYLQGPDGSSWYYTAQYETEEIYYNEYYTDEILHSFTFTIYNNRGQKVGTVHDKIRYAPNEVRDRECVLDPSVSLHFFNTDDNPEVMVYHAMNTDIYVNHYYYSVYSVGGEKDEEGYDVCIATIEGRCVEVVNHGVGAEDYLYTFVEDPVINFPSDDPDYVEKLNALNYKLTTYGKAVNDTDGPRVFLTKNIGATRLPGDTTESVYFMSKRYDGRLFFIYSQYEKPYFIDPRGGADDERATPDNSLEIEVYEILADDSKLISTTVIPVNAADSTEKLTYTFLSIGSVAWTNDVDMKFNGTPDAPAFIVARDVAEASDIDTVISSYYVYDNAGNRIKTIAEDTESMFLYQNGDLQGPLAMFVRVNDDAEYDFIFAYLYSGDQLATISQGNNGDPLYASCYPVKIDGEYKFVFEMKMFGEDNMGNFYARVAWFGTGGQLERIDSAKIGKEVQMAQVYLSNVTLNPKLFDNDDQMEYAVLVKRTYGATARNEYLIVDHNGGLYATYSSDDGKGEPYDLSITAGSPNRMTIRYNDGTRTNTTTVTLPFTTASVGGDDENEEDEDRSAIEEVIADDNASDAIYYDLQGRIVTSPSHGLYIRRVGNKATKIYLR